MTTIAIIPARGGSKGIKNKNISYIDGKRLIFYQLTNAYLATKIDHVIVSSESDRILDEARHIITQNYGMFQNKVIFMKRPQELAEDDVLLEPVIDHVLTELENNKIYADVVCVLQPTSPLFPHLYIDAILSVLENDVDMDSIFTASEFHGFIWTNFDSFTGNKEITDKYFRPIGLYHMKVRRQDMVSRYLENGALYAFEVDSYKVHKTMLHGNIGMYKIPKSFSPELDNLEDEVIITAILQYNRGVR